jgi:hypothetical protein
MENPLARPWSPNPPGAFQMCSFLSYECCRAARVVLDNMVFVGLGFSVCSGTPCCLYVCCWLCAQRL